MTINSGDHLPPPAPVSNEPIDVHGVPRLDDARFVPVDPRHAVGQVAALVLVGVAALVGSALLSTDVDAGVLPVAVGLVVASLFWVLAALTVTEARRIGYQVREHDISLRRGLITHSVETIPFRRVQHVSVTRGPLERTFDLATVDVNSAGPDVSVPGLTVDDANTLRQLIVTRAGLADGPAAGTNATNDRALDQPEDGSIDDPSHTG